jgi:low temperature requirement protein LtrA
MQQQTERSVSREVSPLELFFDLVFVFAISQLSMHLLEHLHWRGLAQTLVMLVGVFGVWSYTSFEVTLTHYTHANTQRVMLVVMAFGLFMNAAIERAFQDGALAFVVPMLLIQIGRTALSTIPAAPLSVLRRHYSIMLAWLLMSAPLWIVGALVPPAARLWWWAMAAAIDLAGTWLAHPSPGRTLDSENIEFDAEHMLERLRLFLIIALGEVVLTSGVALANAPLGLMTVMAGAFALSVIVSLWALYFGGSDHVVSQHVDRTSNPILAARLAMNGEVVVVAGLIALAVVNDVVIAHPDKALSPLVAVLMSGGALAYLLVQIWYLRFVTGRYPRSRMFAAAALLATGAAAPMLPAVVALGLLALVLGVLWIVVAREQPEAQEALSK